MTIRTNVNSMEEVRRSLQQADAIFQRLLLVSEPSQKRTSLPSTASDDDVLTVQSDGAVLYEALALTRARMGEINSFFDGTFVQPFDATITATDGTNIVLTVDAAPTGNLTVNFSTGQFTITSGSTINLDLTGPASAAAPTPNYVYVLASAPTVLVTSTTGWPAASVEHAKVAYLLTPDYTTANALGGCYINQNWNDETANAAGQGHLSHMAQQMREGHAQWRTGCLGTATVVGSDVWVDITAGEVGQMHHHAFDALDSDTGAAGDPIFVLNESGNAYNQITGLHELANDSTGVALGANRYFNVVLWGVANKTGEPELMFINLPSGTYNNLSGAQADGAKYTNATIPPEYNGDSSTGFLIAEFLLRNSTPMTLHETLDLRGVVPSSPGGARGGESTVSADNNLTDTSILVGDGGGKAIKDTGILVEDGTNNVSGMGTLGCGAITSSGNILATSDVILGNVVTALTSVGAPKWDNAGNMTIDVKFATDKTVTIENSLAGEAHVSITEGDLTLTDGDIIMAALATVDGIDVGTDVAANTAKVTNATHTQDVTGSDALTLDPVAITNKPAKAVPTTADTMLIADAAASDALKKSTIAELFARLLPSHIAKLSKRDFPFDYEDPVAGEEFLVGRIHSGTPITVTNIEAETDAGTCEIQFHIRAVGSIGSGSDKIITASAGLDATSGGAATTTFDDSGAVPADKWIVGVIGTVATAVRLSGVIEYTVDD